MKLQKKHLVILYKVLSNTESDSLTSGRALDLFLESLKQETIRFELDEQKIYINMCIKDETGKPTLTERSEYQFDPAVSKKVLEERNTLYNEEVDLKDIDKEMLIALIEKTLYKFKTGEATKIDAIINILNGEENKETTDTKTEEGGEGVSGESVE